MRYIHLVGVKNWKIFMPGQWKYELKMKLIYVYPKRKLVVDRPGHFL